MTGLNYTNGGDGKPSMNPLESSVIRQGDVILIRWIDAVTHGDCTWQDLAETKEDAEKEPPMMCTTGIVLTAADTHIAVTDSIGEEECGHMTKIPRGMIIDIQKLDRLTAFMAHEDMED